MGGGGGTRSVVVVGGLANGEEFGGEQLSSAFCLSILLFPLLSISSCSALSSLILSWEACLARATLLTFLSLPRGFLRCCGLYQVCCGGRLAASMTVGVCEEGRKG